MRTIFAFATQIANFVLVALMFLIPGFMILSFWWAHENNVHHLSLIPSGFKVTHIIEHSSAGALDVPLPSANGSMLVLYELDADVSSQIAAGGIAELERRSHPSATKKARFLTWHTTPFAFNEAWPRELTSGPEDTARIGDFLQQFWPEETSSPNLERQVSSFLHEPDNFYSIDADGHRIMVVAPVSGRVAYGYAK